MRSPITLRRAVFVSFTALAIAAAGCGSSDSGGGETTTDSGVGGDTAVVDSGAPHDSGSATDSGSGDTGSTSDTGKSDTGTTTDSGSADTSTTDSAATDTATSDSTATDTATTDTTATDTATTDTATSDSATTDTADASPSLDAACTKFANDYCTEFNTCSSFYVDLIWGTETTCETRMKVSCLDLLGAPGAGYTPATIMSCGTAYKAESCTDFFGGKVPSGCDVAGTYAAGHACGADAQCASRFCHIASGSCGVCATAPTEGAACMDGQCAEGMSCANYTGGAATGTCQVLGLLGDTCDATNDPCSAMFSCRSGHCVADAAAGTACSTTGTAPDCDVTKALYCDTTGTGLCKLYGEAAAGASCGTLATGLTACTASGTCVASSAGSTTGTCEAAAADGATCNDTTGPSCMNPAFCNASGTCQISDPSTCH